MRATTGSYFERYASTLFDRLRSVIATDAAGQPRPIQEALESWDKMTRAAVRADKVHYFIGNGASAMMASHMALDCVKNGGIRALAFNDAASLTAIGNDLGYEHAFAAPVRWHARSGDAVIAISSSGRSPNIVAALKAARSQGCRTVTLTGMSEGNPARREGDLNFYVAGRTYGCVECAHQLLLHCWLDQYMGLKEWEPAP